MRRSDIHQAPFVSGLTEDLYLPRRARVPLSARPDEELFRGLCAKSRGRLEACETCAGGCAFGRLLLARREGQSAGKEAAPGDTTTKPAS